MSCFESIKLPFRPDKPRSVGLTMVLDNGMGLESCKAFIESAGEYTDIVKFGWGTSCVFPEEIIRKKIALLRDHDVHVCPGGTLTEIAYAQNVVDSFLQEAKKIGFTCIEVSDGSIQMDHEEKLKLIDKVLKCNLTVFSEVGKKTLIEDKRISIEQKASMAVKELEAGAMKVIIEAREVGTFGIFDEKGEVIPECVETFAETVGIPNIIFEAPVKHQQLWLISNLSNAVNLGNIPPNSVINLETLRCGLRSDTMKEYHLGDISVRVENGVPGALSAGSRSDIVIVVDALRASTTIITALAEGVKSVKPVSSAEECLGEITAGERGGKKIPNMTFDNSPLSFRHNACAGKQLTITTTNGTECIRASNINGAIVLIGALVNAKAVAKHALKLAAKHERNISIVMAGKNNRLAQEDWVAASEIVSNLQNCAIKGYIIPTHSTDPLRDFLNSDSGKNLVSLGKEEDVMFCAEKDIYDVVPQWTCVGQRKNEGVLVLVQE